MVPIRVKNSKFTRRNINKSNGFQRKTFFFTKNHCVDLSDNLNIKLVKYVVLVCKHLSKASVLCSSQCLKWKKVTPQRPTFWILCLFILKACILKTFDTKSTFQLTDFATLCVYNYKVVRHGLHSEFNENLVKLFFLNSATCNNMKS